MDRIDKILYYENKGSIYAGRKEGQVRRVCGSCGTTPGDDDFIDEITDYCCDVWFQCPQCKKINYFLS